MSFKTYIEQMFLQWQNAQGGRRTASEFAAYLGVNQSTLSMWWVGRSKPGPEHARQLAEKLGMEVYDELGLKRPDADLHFISSHWTDLEVHERELVRRYVEKLVEHEAKQRRRKPPKTQVHRG